MIGIFDSGIGGLTILSAVSQILPEAKLIYIADSKYLPYGDKSTEFVRKRSFILSNHLIKKGCSLIVVACNTATVATPINSLRKQFQVDFVGVEPPIKLLTKKTKKKALLIATTNTVKSKQVKKLLSSSDGQKTVKLLALPALVPKIEQIPPDKKKITKYLQEHITKKHINDYDVLGLGCTHYPLIKETISQAINHELQIIDVSQPVALRVKEIYSRPSSQNCVTNQYFSTDNPKQLQEALKYYYHTNQQVSKLHL